MKKPGDSNTCLLYTSGHLVAQYSLAKLYLSDDVEVRDIRQGMNWLYTAAVNGSSYAMYRLAKELLKGDLIKRNSDAAVEWFTQSAERGNPYAQYMPVSYTHLDVYKRQTLTSQRIWRRSSRPSTSLTGTPPRRRDWAICMKVSWKRTQMRKSPVPGSISRPAF